MSRYARVPRVATALVAVIGIAAFPCQTVVAEVRPLTLYERSGRAPMVVLGAVLDGDDRYASVQVLECLKCPLPVGSLQSLRIVYRLDSFLRKPWEEKIIFVTGERILLFARPFTKEDGDQTAPDLFTLMWGAQGKELLPSEGEAVRVEAVRAFLSILGESDIDRQAERLRAAIAERNPVLAETALEELSRQGLGEISLIGELTGLFSHEREQRRILSMRLLAGIISDAGASGRPVPLAEDLGDLVRGRAALDPSAGFRVEAVEVLARLGGPSNEAFLRRAAKEDADQGVRYAAEKWLLTRPSSGGGR